MNVQNTDFADWCAYTVPAFKGLRKRKMKIKDYQKVLDLG